MIELKVKDVIQTYWGGQVVTGTIMKIQDGTVYIVDVHKA